MYFYVGYWIYGYTIILNVFVAFSAYEMALKSVNSVFFSVTITSAPCLRSVRAGMLFFPAYNLLIAFVNGLDMKKNFFSFISFMFHRH